MNEEHIKKQVNSLLNQCLLDLDQNCSTAMISVVSIIISTMEHVGVLSKEDGDKWEILYKEKIDVYDKKMREGMRKYLGKYGN